MMIANTMSAALQTDAELVGATLSGNRDAFGQIVSRYQSLVCSLAFSATGSLSQSEDLAQETFITAWTHLSHLRERDKLRAWLCGIARNCINGFLRREGREPASAAASLEELAESHSPEPLPVEYTISNEESAILWRTLEKIPDIYREPLVLFYREHQSVERVAEALELSEDAVHQRLSRGRKMLHEQVLAFVEGALEKTAPGKHFTLGVLAALPVAVASAKAATVGAALAKGGAAAKGVATVGTLGGLLAMLGGAYISFKAQIDDSKSPRERKFMQQQWYGKRMLISLAVFAPFFVALSLDYFRAPLHAEFLAATFLFVLCAYGTAAVAYHVRQRLRIQIEDNTFVAAEWIRPRKATDDPGDSAEARAKARLKMVKWMAFAIGMTIFVMTQESWKQHPGHAVLVTAFMVVCLVRGFWQWRNMPRFQSLRAGWFVVFPVLLGLLTLFFFNYYQHLARISSDVSRIATPAEVIAFNVAVVLAYAALVGVIVLKRKSAIPNDCPKANTH